jgi:hypothetical protein
VLHPVGKRPAAVYWRRRLVLLVVLLAVLGGGGWFGYLLVSRHLTTASAASATSSTSSPPGTPALEQVVPSVVTLQTPSAPATTTAAAPRVTTPAAPAPKPGGPCTDAMIAVTVRAPAVVAVDSKPTFTLSVTNISAVPCVRNLDKGQQEVVLADAAGHRIWGSNDCFPEASSDTRTLPPHSSVPFPLIWGGLTSAPGCTAARVHPRPGDYLLRGRLATKLSPVVPIKLG